MPQKDKSKLVRKKIRDKRGKWTTVWVKVAKTRKVVPQRSKQPYTVSWNKYYDKWTKGLSSLEKRALDNYAGSDYHIINSVARGKIPLSAVIDVTRGGYSVKQGIRAISKALDRTKLPHNAVLYRGVIDRQRWADDLGKGDIIEDSGFTSTSTDEQVALDIPSWHGLHMTSTPSGMLHNPLLLFEIHAKKGAKAGDMKAVFSIGENEMLLPRKAKLEVISVSKKSGWVGHIFYGEADNPTKIIKLRYK